MRHIRFHSATRLFLVSIALAAGCGSDDPKPAPIFKFIAGASLTGSPLAVPFDFGRFPVSTDGHHATITLINTGERDGYVQGVDSGSLGLSAPFTVIDAEGVTAELPACAAGLVLAPSQGCLITIDFTPTATGNFNTTLQLTYATSVSTDPAKPAPTKTSTLQLLATSYLDCGKAPYKTFTAQGADAANVKMADETAKGTFDGSYPQLDDADGKIDGRADGYKSGYDTAYRKAYDPAHKTAYDQYYLRGRSDAPSCANGERDGTSKGQADGRNDGSKDGYDDGYADGFANGAGFGYNDGYSEGLYVGSNDGSYAGSNDGAAYGKADGYDVGYDDGQEYGYDLGFYDAGLTCDGGFGEFSRPRKLPPARDVSPAKQYSDACYTQGFNDTYVSGKYNQAYQAAKQANTQYWTGYNTGKTEGVALGTTDGTAKGQKDGNDQGVIDGWADGTQTAYLGCYNAKYTSVYNSTYTTYYNSYYPSGKAAGSQDAYNRAYNNGYSVGYAKGRSNTYQPTYNAYYSDAYNYWYPYGYADGEAYGYDLGFFDGEDYYCGSSYFSIASHDARAKTAHKARGTLKVPTPVVPAQPLERDRSQRGETLKAQLAATAKQPSLYGTVLPGVEPLEWWDADRQVATYASAVLPSIVKDELLATGQFQVFEDLRSKDEKGAQGRVIGQTLRKFLLEQNRSQRLASTIVKPVSVRNLPASKR